MSESVLDALRERRSVRSFTDAPVERASIETLLELAVLAPNHRMTEPWRFVILGPEARRAYGVVKGRGRAAKLPDPSTAAAVVEKTVGAMEAVPAMIAFVQRLSEDPGIREEDYATLYMAVQNVLVGAVALGLGTHVRTGAALDDPETRTLLALAADERVVALVEVGEPAELPSPRPRTPARERTTWLP